MKINNNNVYFRNPNKLSEENIKFYAMYDYTDKDVKYLCTVKTQAFVDYLYKYNVTGHTIYGYARKTQKTRGKTGRYYVTECHCGVVRQMFYQDKNLALKRAVHVMNYKSDVSVVDTTTGEVLFMQEEMI